MKTLLETERLYFRNIVSEDCKEMFLLNADWDVLKYTGDILFNTIKEARDFYEEYQTTTYQKFGYGRMATLLKDTNELIGWCGLKYHPEEDEVDLGFRFHKRFWNKGYGTEASLACLDYGHQKLNINEVVAFAMKENIGSCRVLEKVGFDYVGMANRYDKMWRHYTMTLPINNDTLLHQK